MKDFKIRHYDYARAQQRKQNIRSALVTLLITAAAAAAGWFIYPTVYELVTDYETFLSRLQQPEDLSFAEPEPDEVEPGPADLPSDDGPESMLFPQAAVYLSTEVMEDGDSLDAALSSLARKGVDGVVFDLKDVDGMVRYKSSLELVESNRAQAEDPFVLSRTLDRIRRAGMIPIGRLYAFKDHTATAHMYESAVKYMDSPVNWIDDSKANGGKPWLNPNDRDAQDYILALVEEAAGSGLGIILLDGVQFPEGVSLNLATYGNTGTLNKSAILADFLVRAKEAGEKAGCQVATTVNLISAAGLSDVRYGDDVGRLISAAGSAVVEVMPEQFGNGVTSETLTLSAPVQDPYRTVSQALAASRSALLLGTDEQEDGDGDPDQAQPEEKPLLGAVIQAYTSQSLSESANKEYGPQELQAQVRAVQEVGIRSIFYLDPNGAYDLLG